jgi:hypothetical protein
MKRGTLGAAAAVCFIVSITSTAGATVVLRSAEMADGSGGRYQPGFGQGGGGFFNPTTYSPAVPFPNDARNSAAIGSEGLRVVANNAAYFTHSLGNSLSEGWSAHKFQVLFDLDEPAAYTYTRQIANTDDWVGVMTLQADGQPPITGLPLFGEKSGMLPAGHYTFSGVADGQNMGPGSGQFFTGWGGYSLVLTVAPEPAALPLLGGLMLLTLRRRSW